jgi:hypothetical protein
MARTKDNDFDTNYPAPPNWGEMKNLRIDQYRKEDVDDTVKRVLKTDTNKQRVNRGPKKSRENTTTIYKRKGY